MDSRILLPSSGSTVDLTWTGVYGPCRNVRATQAVAAFGPRRPSRRPGHAGRRGVRATQAGQHSPLLPSTRMLAFFGEEAVRQAIEDLASSERVTIVAGAGASMEIGLPSWEDLVLAL